MASYKDKAPPGYVWHHVFMADNNLIPNPGNIPNYPPNFYQYNVLPTPTAIPPQKPNLLGGIQYDASSWQSLNNQGNILYNYDPVNQPQNNFSIMQLVNIPDHNRSKEHNGSVYQYEKISGTKYGS